jgi:hypothetical protein
LPKWRFDSSCQGPVGLSFAEVAVWLLKKEEEKKGAAVISEMYIYSMMFFFIFWVFGLFYNVCCGIRSSRVLSFLFRFLLLIQLMTVYFKITTH